MLEVTKMKDCITLPDGREVTMDEFFALSPEEQSAVLKCSAKSRSSGSDATHEGRRVLLPRLQAAAESNKITEEELLTFIKVMHDIFFPPAPVSSKDADPLAKRVKQKYGGAFVQQSKRVMTPLGEFPSQAAAGRAYNTDGARIRCWIKEGKQGFYYLDASK
jgi:hypothetical protein